MCDIFDPSVPKYKTAQSIYDSLCEMVQTEEMSILSDMFPDVSYDNEAYYYTSKGYELKEKFEKLSDYGNKMWVMELAVVQMDGDFLHDTIYEALWNTDLANRLGFKNLFVKHMLRGDATHYREIINEYHEQAKELRIIDWHPMVSAFMKVMGARGRNFFGIYPDYNPLCWGLKEKINNLHLHKEVGLIAECRAILSAYDDFMYALRMNQAMYEAQERQFKMERERLQAAYEDKVKLLYLIAERNGIQLAPLEDARPLALMEQNPPPINESGFIPLQKPDDD